MKKVAVLSAFLLLAIIPLLFIELNHGYSPNDGGFVLAYAWRVFNGQVPHRDFIFVRTPLSPILHSLWFFLPEGLPIIASRLGFYLQMLSTGLLPFAWAIYVRQISWTFATACLAIISIYFAIHTFPPMPWYTVDGAMFFTIGTVAYLFSLRAKPDKINNHILKIIAGVAFALAPLAKQNFAVTLPFYLVLLALEWTFSARKKSDGKPILLGVLSMAATLGGFAMVLKSKGALTAMVEQIRSSSDPLALKMAGFDSYKYGLMSCSFALPLGIFLGMGSRLSHVYRPVKVFLSIVFSLLPFSMFIYFLHSFQHGKTFTFIWLYWFVAGTGFYFWIEWFIQRDSLRKREFAIFCSSILLLGWTSSISWGTNSPLLGFAGFGVLIAKALGRLDKRVQRFWLFKVGVALAVLTVITSIMWNRIYHPSYEWANYGQQTKNLAEIYPRFFNFKSGDTNYVALMDLKTSSAELKKQFNRPLIVMPEHPLYYYLENTINPASVDFWHFAEIAGYEDRLKKEIISSESLVLLLIHPAMVDQCKVGNYAYLFPEWVAKTGKLIKKTKYLCIFDFRGVIDKIN